MTSGSWLTYNTLSGSTIRAQGAQKFIEELRNAGLENEFKERVRITTMDKMKGSLDFDTEFATF